MNLTFARHYTHLNNDTAVNTKHLQYHYSTYSVFPQYPPPNPIVPFTLGDPRFYIFPYFAPPSTSSTLPPQPIPPQLNTNITHAHIHTLALALSRTSAFRNYLYFTSRPTNIHTHLFFSLSPTTSPPQSDYPFLLHPQSPAPTPSLFPRLFIYASLPPYLLPPPLALLFPPTPVLFFLSPHNRAMLAHNHVVRFSSLDTATTATFEFQIDIPPTLLDGFVVGEHTSQQQ